MQADTLLILSNFNEALHWHQENKPSLTYFCPQIFSEPQKKFFLSRFENLKKQIPELKMVHTSQLSDLIKQGQTIAVSAWNGHRERQLINSVSKKYFYLKQNRLFQSFDFDAKTFFTSFRKKIEPQLPLSFPDPYQYQDSDLKKHLNKYFGTDQYAKSYFETRNALMGQHFSTQLSAYLSCGTLNVQFLYNQVKAFEAQYGPNKSTYWIIFELLWREFFYHSGQFYGNLIFAKDGLKGSSNFSDFSYDESQLSSALSQNILMACAYKELTETGFLSNRMRQLFASYLINDLELDWRVGACFFEKYLIDYDMYSNYGNWQYLAGVGHDPRGKRSFNQQKQIQTYDPNNEYINYWKNR